MTRRHRSGEIRLRSNVIMSSGRAPKAADWELVPGEIVREHNLHFASTRRMNTRQLDEQGYYKSCLECGRLAHAIAREGCDNPRCSDPPSAVSVAAARDRNEEALAIILAEQERLDREVIETEHPTPADILDPEAAVTRFLERSATSDLTHKEPAGASIQSLPPITAIAPAAAAEVALGDGQVPSALVSFLADAINRDEMTAQYLRLGVSVKLAVKVPLPLEGAVAFLLDEEQAEWMSTQRAILRARLEEAPDESFGAMAEWYYTLPAVPLPQLVVQRFDRFLRADELALLTLAVN
jgi:hypothetical protein